MVADDQASQTGMVERIHQRVDDSRKVLVAQLREHQPLLVLASLSLVLSGFIRSTDELVSSVAAAASLCFVVSLAASLIIEMSARGNPYLSWLSLGGAICGLALLVGVAWKLAATTIPGRLVFGIVTTVGTAGVFLPIIVGSWEDYATREALWKKRRTLGNLFYLLFFATLLSVGIALLGIALQAAYPDLPMAFHPGYFVILGLIASILCLFARTAVIHYWVEPRSAKLAAVAAVSLAEAPPEVSSGSTNGK